MGKITAAQSLTERDFQRHFDAYGVRGSFLLYDLQADRYTAHNPARCRTGFLPASTFKIPNTLIGLETGVIPDTSYVIKWDGTVREIAAWNRDHTLASALRVSCVPYYQELARRVGLARYRDWLAKLRFGTLDVQAENVDKFWLEGRSRITAFEQIDFLKRLYLNQLPLSRRSTDLTKTLLFLRTENGATLRGKTGWSNSGGFEGGSQHHGWMVGWVERAGQAHLFALEVEPLGNGPAPAQFVASRRAIAELILREMKVL